MIAAGRSPIAYLWEPFSVLHRPGILATRFPYWFPYLCEENGERYVADIRRMLQLRYRPLAELASVRSPKDGLRMGRDWAKLANARRAGARPLLKDPIAVFSAEWLADRFDMDVVVLVRHPAAFAHSLKARGLTHPFSHFLAQPLLMRDHLGPYEEEIRAFAASERPPLEQAILLWKLVYSTVARFRERRPAWLVLRLEDVASEPLGAFERIYERLGLPFDDAARRAVLEHSDPSNPAEVADPAARHRDSRASVVVWRSRLDEDEVARVRVGVEPVAKEFYADADW